MRSFNVQQSKKIKQDNVIYLKRKDETFAQLDNDFAQRRLTAVTVCELLSIDFDKIKQNLDKDNKDNKV